MMIIVDPAGKEPTVLSILVDKRLSTQAINAQTVARKVMRQHDQRVGFSTIIAGHTVSSVRAYTSNALLAMP
jgi:hypothetical protein